MRILHTFLFFLLAIINTYANIEWAPSEYLKYSTSQRNDANELIEKIYPDKNIQTIWDIGCGTGNNINAFLTYFSPKSILASDISETMCQTAQKVFVNNKKVTIKHLDTKTFSSRKPFDLAISIHIMHWISKEDMPLVLRNIHQNLSEKGKFSSVFSASKEGLPFQIALNKLKTSEKYKSALTGFVLPQVFYNAEEFKTLLRHASFSDVDLNLVKKTKTFEGRDALLGFITQWLSESKYIAKTQPALATQFLSDLVDAYLIDTNQTKEPHIQWQEYTFFVIANK